MAKRIVFDDGIEKIITFSSHLSFLLIVMYNKKNIQDNNILIFFRLRDTNVLLNILRHLKTHTANLHLLFHFIYK